MKAHGAGNDFVLLPDPDDRLTVTPALVRALCEAHVGLGADGVIRVAPATAGSGGDVFMDYWNADGTVAEMCGNGVRCVAKYVADRGLRGDVVRVDTRGGVKPVTVTRGADGRVSEARVDMGAPHVGQPRATVLLDGVEHAVTTLSMGNPHAVLLVDDIDKADVGGLGSRLERHPDFLPQGTNVEFVQPVASGRILGRIWERGVGETRASGTGASAMAVAAHLNGAADRCVTVALPGGELDVAWGDETLEITGPAVEVASGELDETWLTNIR